MVVNKVALFPSEIEHVHKQKELAISPNVVQINEPEKLCMIIIMVAIIVTIRLDVTAYPYVLIRRHLGNF